MNDIRDVGQQHTFFYKLLLSPEAGYRISRHTLFILCLFAMSFNQTYMAFPEYSSELGVKVYFFTFFILISYLIEGYFNMYVLIPRLFLKGRFVVYFAIFFTITFIVVLFHYALEYVAFRMLHAGAGVDFYFENYGSPFWLELLSSYFVDCIAILGAGITVILKYWLANDAQVHRLEKVHMETEVEKLKEQVNPTFLFSILHKIGDLTPENQQKASDLLMELSEVLRYQLYDCNRDKVLLNAEIQFITTYLQIEKLYYGEMDFEIKTEGNMNRMFVPPLLFIPLVQGAVKAMQEKGNYFSQRLSFKSGDNFVLFECDNINRNLLSSSGFKKMKRRLDTLYPGKYILDMKEDESGSVPVVYLYIKYL